MTRFSLALILLFIAPEAWGQNICYAEGKTWLAPEENGMIICHTEDAEARKYQCPDGTTYPPDKIGATTCGLTNSSGTFTPPPSCEPGWTIVMQGAWGPKCAWVLKEPIYK
jgi:hypothetical protein